MAMSDNGQAMYSDTGLWNCPRIPRYSKETQELLTLMMQETRLTNFQQRQITSQLKKGGALPLTCNPTSSASPSIPKPNSTIPAHMSARQQKRSAAACRSGDNYTREKFCPSAARDLEKEKKRLQDLFSMGKEQLKVTQTQSLPEERRDKDETDRVQEVLEEIEERKKFLEEMTALGKGKNYHSIISTEISQKIRELELIDRACTTQQNGVTDKQREGVDPLAPSE